MPLGSLTNIPLKYIGVSYKVYLHYLLQSLYICQVTFIVIWYIRPALGKAPRGMIQLVRETCQHYFLLFSGLNFYLIICIITKAQNSQIYTVLADER